jgi:hypothetical protein
MNSPTDQNRIKVVEDYFRLADQGSREILELFHEDAEIYYPKFGFGFGRQSFFELTKGFEGALEFVLHDYDNLTIIPAGDYVFVEGRHAASCQAKRGREAKLPAADFAMSSSFVAIDCQACMSTLIRTTPGRMPPGSGGA